MDYFAALDKAKRQRMLADQLRKKANEAPPQGRMFGRHYAAPSMFTQLSPLIHQAGALYTENRASDAEREAQGQIRAAKDKWVNDAPQDVQQQTAPFMAPGIDGDENIPGTETITQKADPLTYRRVLKHALAGGDIPGNEGNVKMYEAGMRSELDREDKQQDKREAAHTKVIADAEAKALAGDRRMEELKEKLALAQTPEQKMEIAKMIDATRRYTADVAAAARIRSSENSARAAGNKVTPIPNAIIKDMSGAQSVAEGIASSYTSYKPEYAGVTGAVNKFSGTWNPLAGKQSTEAANWWKSYDNQSALVERHEKFGTTLNPGEKAAWTSATIAPGMTPSVIEHNLRIRTELAAKFYNRLRQQHMTLGRQAIGDAFEPMSESYEPVPVEAPVKSTGTPTVQRTGVAPPQRALPQTLGVPAGPPAAAQVPQGTPLGLPPSWRLVQ